MLLDIGIIHLQQHHPFVAQKALASVLPHFKRVVSISTGKEPPPEQLTFHHERNICKGRVIHKLLPQVHLPPEKGRG